MARKVSVQLVDDIDDTIIDDESGETIEFSVSGVDYVIDLKSRNATEFHRKLDYYISYATRIGGRRRKATVAAAPAGSSVNTTKRDPAQTRAIRQWAADQGYDISDRGRIPAEIVEAYDAAH